MKNVINFLIRNVYVLIFLLLQGIALALVVSYNPFQRGAFMASSNVVSSKLFSVSNNVNEYFALRQKNESLAGENTLLKNQIELLQEKLELINVLLSDNDLIESSDYAYIGAKVINKTTSNMRNYLTLNRGARDGIESQMGVVSANGLVGHISSVSERFSVVIPIINTKIKVSAMLRPGNYAGSLAWDGKDPRFALLEGIPRHVEVSVGDTLVSSGFSSIFPEGIFIGTVHEFKKENAGNNYYIKVKLSTDFYTLSHVDVIRYRHRAERDSLEAGN